MPIRWGPAEDQTLLLLVLEVHQNLNLDTNGIASAWPVSEGQERPTPRAIREHLVKLRNSAKQSGNGGNFTIGKARGPKSAASTNTKAVTTRGPVPATPRKRTKTSAVNVKCEQDDANSVLTAPNSPDGPMSYPTPTSAKSAKVVPRGRKRSRSEDLLDSEEDEPFSREDKISTRGHRVEVYQADEGEAYTSGSEYNPDKE